ncbi:hypothetical protein LDENG_00046870, partial [Lucifuga dentata]
MEEKKKKKQEEKTKKDTAQKKVADQKTKVPEPTPAKPSPGPPHHLHPASPTLPLSSSSSSSSSSGNGKRTSSSSQLSTPTPTPPQQQCQLSSASARYPPREVPPRFRQQEHKQLLKRGQPLPAGALSTLTLSSSCTTSSLPSSSYSSSSSATSSTTPNSATSAAGKRHPDLFLQSGPGAQNETSHWGASVPVESSSANTWDKVIIDRSDTEAWPSINHNSEPIRPAAPECPLGSANSNPDTSAVTPTSNSSSFLSMATGAAGQQAHYSSLKANGNMMTGPGAATTITGNRSWGSDGKQDGMNGGRGGAPNSWGSHNFNL